MERDRNGFPLPAVAVVYPVHTDSLLAPERDIILSAHGQGLVRGLRRAGFRACAFSTGPQKDGATEIAGPMWSLQTVRELLHRFQDFAPDVIVVEHSPLGFGKEMFVPATIAMWARSHRIDICTISHSEPGLRSTARAERIATALRTSGALFAHSFSVMVHSPEWEEELRDYLPEARNAIEFYQGWPLLEPTGRITPDPRIRLAVILDDALPGAIERGLAQLDVLPAEMDVALLAPLSAPAVAERYVATLRRIEGNSTLTLLGDELTIKRQGRTISFIQPATLHDLANILLETDAMVELPTRSQPSARWRETARAFGVPYIRIGLDPGTSNPDEITEKLRDLYDFTRKMRDARPERIEAYAERSCWKAIGDRIVDEMHAPSHSQRIEAGLLAAPQEGIEQPAVAFGEIA